MVADDIILNKILVIRNKKVMIDSDLAKLYHVTTKRLNEQVKRNAKRFPEDFMFQLTLEEKAEVVANCDHLSNLKYSPSLPNVFTEHGAVMLAGILNSETAIQVNIRIIRVFNRMREGLGNYNDLLSKLEQVAEQTVQHSDDIKLIFDHLNKLLLPPAQQGRRRIGFRRKDEDG